MVIAFVLLGMHFWKVLLLGGTLEDANKQHVARSVGTVFVVLQRPTLVAEPAAVRKKTFQRRIKNQNSSQSRLAKQARKSLKFFDTLHLARFGRMTPA